MKTGLKVEGFKELEEGLFELKSSTAKGVVRRSMKASLAPVADDMRDGAPEEDGQLRDSIAVTTKLTKSQRREARGQFNRNHTVHMYVGAGAPHAHLVELGTGPRVQTSTGRATGEVEPQPFARPAWESGRSGTLRRFVDEMRANLAKSIERARRKAERAARK